MSGTSASFLSSRQVETGTREAIGIGQRTGLRVQDEGIMKTAIASGARRGRMAAVVLLLLLASPLFAKRKDDVVVMENGDTFTGEIQGLQRGELLFKSDYMADSVHLDWKRVKQLESKDTYIVTLQSGKRVIGKIAQAAGGAGEEFQVLADGGTVRVKSQHVIAIRHREVSFWNQLTGSVNYGLSFSSDNRSTNSSLGASVAYYAAKNSVNLSTTSQFDSQSNATNTNRFTFDSRYGHQITDRWFAGGILALLKSNQQDLDLRASLGGLVGRKLLQTNRTSLLLMGGAVYSHERYFPQVGSAPASNGEALVGLTFSTFRFKKVDINSQTLVFPSISDPGRVRVGSQSNLEIELLRNFFWNFQFYENFDSRPPVVAPRNDLGVTTSLGWKF
jgi:putative salt-induced outer membrane protein YdiY